MVEPRKVRCRAKSKRSGKSCQRWAVKGWNVCQVHGAGGGAPIKSGLYSESFNAQGAARYEVFRKHPKLLDLTETTAAMDTIIEALGKRIAQGDTPEFRTRALELVDEMIAARGQPDGEAGKRFQELVDFLRRGAEATRSETVLFERIERIAKRKEEANKILHAKENAIPRALLDDLFTALTAALNAHVDEVHRKAVLRDLASTWGEPANRIDGTVSQN